MRRTHDAKCAPCSDGEFHPIHDDGAPVVVATYEEYRADRLEDPEFRRLYERAGRTVSAR